MKKLVIKTALITLLSVFLAGVILFFSLFFASPKTLADFNENIGFHSLSVFFHERQYLKTEDNEDLIDMLYVLDDKKDAVLSEKYITVFMGKDFYGTYCSYIDGNSDSNVKTNDYFNGRLTIATYYGYGLTTAINKAKAIVQKDGYASFSPFKALVLSCGEDLSTADLSALKTQIETLKSSYSGADLINANGDVNLISLKLS